MKQLKANLTLLIAALIWGLAFVAQSIGMDYVGPYTFLTARSIIGCIVLIPCIFLLDKFKINSKNIVQKNQKGNMKTLIIGGT